MELVRGDSEVHVIVMDQVPRVGRELVFDAVQKLRRTEQAHMFRAAEADAQQSIEAGKVVHVGVRDEHVADAQQLPRGQAADVTDIEQQRATGEPEVDQQCRITERTVDEFGCEYRAHYER
jgi:hypothetical protein